MYRNGQLSAGAACGFAGIDRYTFIESCKAHHIAVIDYDHGDVEADIERLTGERQKC